MLLLTPQAEAEFLQSMMEAGVAPGSPIREQALRYLDVLQGNSSWTFVQKKLAVQVGGEEHGRRGAAWEKGRSMGEGEEHGRRGGAWEKGRELGRRGGAWEEGSEAGRIAPLALLNSSISF